MADLQTKTLDTLVAEEAAAVQGASTQLADVQVGSILRAVLEAFAAVVLWLQGLILQVLALTRASTSDGADLDSWMDDYDLPRLPAVAATGIVTFSRFTTGLQAAVPVGAIVQTADASRRYTVVADADHPNWDATEGDSGGYVLESSAANIAVPVSATVAGTAGNVIIGGISSLATAISGVDTVSNLAALNNGADAESDNAFRERFRAYLSSLARGTPAAVGFALNSVQQGMNYALVENYSYAGDWEPGYFYVVCDDGSGDPSSDFMAACASAVESYRPVGSRYGVFAPIIVTASTSCTISAATGYDHAAVVGLVALAITNYINSLRIGVALRYSRLAQVAYDASPGVTNVSGLLLDGNTLDIIATNKHRIMSGTITVS